MSYRYAKFLINYYLLNPDKMNEMECPSEDELLNDKNKVISHEYLHFCAARDLITGVFGDTLGDYRFDDESKAEQTILKIGELYRPGRDSKKINTKSFYNMIPKSVFPEEEDEVKKKNRAEELNVFFPAFASLAKSWNFSNFNVPTKFLWRLMCEWIYKKYQGVPPFSKMIMNPEKENETNEKYEKLKKLMGECVILWCREGDEVLKDSPEFVLSSYHNEEDPVEKNYKVGLCVTPAFLDKETFRVIRPGRFILKEDQEYNEIIKAMTDYKLKVNLD